MSDLFDQIAKASNPKTVTGIYEGGLEMALKKSMDNFDTVHAELMEAIEIIKESRKHVPNYTEDFTLERIDNFLKKHS